MFPKRFFNLRMFAARYWPKLGAAAAPISEVTSGPHRYLWMPAHTRAGAWTPHLRAFTWTFHRRDE